jgi:molecular chaperone DnaK (HSP70)
MIPGTATGTQQLVAQNDIPLNDIVESTINNAIKPFLEMLIERNFAFKEVESLLTVFKEEDIKKMQADAEIHAEEDKKKKELVEIKNTAEMIIYTAEKAVKENETKIPDGRYSDEFHLSA